MITGLGSVVPGTKTLHAPGSKPNADERVWALIKNKLDSNKPMELRELPKRVVSKLSMKADQRLVERAHKLHDEFLLFAKSLKGLELKRGPAAMAKLRKVQDKDIRALARYSLTIEGTSSRHARKLGTLLNRYGALQAAMQKRYGWLTKTREKESGTMSRKMQRETEKAVKKIRVIKANRADVLRLSMELKNSHLMEHGHSAALMVDEEIEWFQKNPNYVVTKRGEKWAIVFGSKEYEAMEDNGNTIIGTPGVHAFSNSAKAIEGLRERFIGHIVTINRKDWVIVDSMRGTKRNQAIFLALQIGSINGDKPQVIKWKVADLAKAARSVKSKVRHDMVMKARQKAMSLIRTTVHEQENIDRIKELDVRTGDTVMVQYTKPKIQREEPVRAVNAARGTVTVKSGYGADEREIEGRYILHVTSSNH